MMSRHSSNRRCGHTAVALAALLSFGTAYAGDETADQNRNYISDSSTDRTPAKTSFPVYPRIARRDRIEGVATVCFKVDLNGRIRSVKVRDYSDRIFRRPALRAIKDSSFEPLQPHEVLSTSRTCRTYRFRLEPIVAARDPE